MSQWKCHSNIISSFTARLRGGIFWMQCAPRWLTDDPVGFTRSTQRMSERRGASKFTESTAGSLGRSCSQVPPTLHYRRDRRHGFTLFIHVHSNVVLLHTRHVSSPGENAHPAKTAESGHNTRRCFYRYDVIRSVSRLAESDDDARVDARAPFTCRFHCQATEMNHQL